MGVEIVSRDIIKPSSPTPHHLRHLKLSFFDQVAPDIYPKLVFFYGPDSPLTPNPQKSLILRSSLSQTLTRFYPFAGRIRDDRSMECDDSGADYIEARFSGDLSTVLEVPHAEMLQQFMPVVPETATKGKLLVVQVTFFDDGGLAIGYSSSHKISDGPTASVFLRSWVACARKDETIMLPEFVLGTHFPAKDRPVMIPTYKPAVGCNGLVLKRFVFTASKLAQLKKLTGGTRVESVMALIWKVGMTESKFTDKGHSRSSVLNCTVDLRQRNLPPLKESVTGNFTGLFMAKHTGSEVMLELHHLVSEMRRALKEHVRRGAKDGWVVEMERLWETVKSIKETHDDLESYGFASWSRMPAYDMDFGWGKPVLACPATFPHENMTVLMSMGDGKGLEAWIMLEPDRMNRFLHNQEMLAFASVDPSVSLLGGEPLHL